LSNSTPKNKDSTDSSWLNYIATLIDSGIGRAKVEEDNNLND